MSCGKKNVQAHLEIPFAVCRCRFVDKSNLSFAAAKLIFAEFQQIRQIIWPNFALEGPFLELACIFLLEKINLPHLRLE